MTNAKGNMFKTLKAMDQKEGKGFHSALKSLDSNKGVEAFFALAKENVGFSKPSSAKEERKDLSFKPAMNKIPYDAVVKKNGERKPVLDLLSKVVDRIPTR